MKKTYKAFFFEIERILILSPFAWSFIVLFNFPDSKHTLSRIILVTAAYCALRFYPEWKVKLSDINFKKLFLILSITIIYFSIMHLVNDGNMDFSRSMFYCLLYFLFFPISSFNKDYFLKIVALGSIINGFMVLFVFDVELEGRWAVNINPIPYSYYSSLCLIILCVSLFNELIQPSRTRKFTVLVYALGILSSLLGIYTSETRASWLGIFIIFLFVMLVVIYRSRSWKTLAMCVTLSILSALLLSKVESIEQRIVDAVNQVSDFKKGDFKSSAGVRVQLWLAGLDLGTYSPLIGLEKDIEQSLAKSELKNKAFPRYLTSYLIHPNVNYHNQYIQSFVKSGILGFMVLSLYICSVLVPSRKSYHRHTALGVFLFTLVFLFFDSVFLYNHTVYLYTLFTMSLCFIGLSDDSRRPQ